MILKPWSFDGSLEKQELDSTPVWIQFPELPPRLWSSNNLSKLASFFGRPLATDRLTGQRTRMEFARVLVDVKVGATLPEEVPIKGHGGIELNQKVLYE